VRDASESLASPGRGGDTRLSYKNNKAADAASKKKDRKKY
jgi:hypothetical protein